MANRKTVEQKIAEAQAKIKQEQNALKQLQNQQKEQDRKARNHRLCKRHGLIESLLPDTATLTDEQFKMFLEQHIANRHGRDKLALIIEQGKNNQPPKAVEATAQPTIPAPTKPAVTEQNGKPTAPAGAEQQGRANPNANGRNNTAKVG